MTWYEQLTTWSQAVEAEPVPEPPALRWVLLPSDTQGFWFRAKFGIMPSTHGLNVTENELNRILCPLLPSLEQIARSFSVVHEEEAEDALKEYLEPETFEIHVKLLVDEDAKRAARRHLQLRWDASFAEEELRVQIREWTRLREEIMHDPSLIRLWWTRGEPARLVDMMAQGDLFERAAQAMVSRSVPDRVTPSAATRTARLLEEFWSQLAIEDRRYMMGRVEHVFRTYDQPELADEFRESVSALFAPEPFPLDSSGPRS